VAAQVPEAGGRYLPHADQYDDDVLSRPDQLAAARGGEPAPVTPPIAGTHPEAAESQDGITPERLKQVIRRLETGFYDAPEVREHIARRVRQELDP